MATKIGQLKYSVGFDVKKADLNSLKKQLQQLSKFTISDLMKINNIDRDSAKKALNDIREQAQRVKDALNTAFNAKLDTINIETFNKTLKDSGSSLQQVYNTFQKSGVAGQNAFRSLVTQITTTNVQLKQSHKWLDNIATTLGNTIKWNIASTAVNTLSNSVQQAWGFVKSLDTSLNDIRIVTGKSADQMANFAVQANDAAKSLGKTTVDYTKAALIYAQQGLSDDEVAARAAITLKTANVTGQSADAVSEQLTSVWNGYKVNAEQAELYIDRLAAVAATTASDLEELSTGMSKVASAAAAMGVGEDQLAAQLSTIISVTRQAPESVGTALRTIYARISDIKAGIDEDGVTLGKYSGKMAELGFNVLDANGKLRDMGQVIEDIGGRWQDLTREQQVSLAQTMAGQRQYSNLIALFDNFQEYNKALSTAQNAAGTLQKQQDVYMESTRAHLNQLKAATEDLYDSLVNPDAMEPLIDGLSTAATAAAKFVDAIGGGGNLLLSLGGIAVNVFSGHLTKGIQTFVHNFTLGNQQVKIMEANLETLNSIDLSSVDNNTAGMIDTIKRTETALSKNATSEEFKEMNNILNQIKTAVNEYAIIDKETENLEKQFSKAQKATGMKYKDMADYLNRAADQYDRFDKILDTTSNGYDKAVDAADQFINAVVQQNGSVKIGKENVEQLKKALQDIKNTDFSLPGFQKPRQDIDNTLHALEQIQNKNLSDSEYKKFVEKVKQHFKDLRDATQITTDVIQEQVNKQGEATKKINQELQSSDENLKEIGKQEAIRAIGKLTGSFTQLGTSVNITASAIRQLKKGDISSGLSALSASLTSVITAAVSAGKAIHALGATVGAATGWGIALGAISLVTSALVAHKQAAEEARQAQIELNNTTIENQQKNQEQIDKKQQLLLAVKDLNEEYENGQITRQDLRNEIENLCDQYGIEQGYIDRLIDRYGDLAQGIRQARIEQAKRKQESFQTQLQAARDNITDYIGQTIRSNGSTSTLFNEQSELGKIISSYGGIYKKSFTGGGQIVNRYIDVATLPTNEQQAIELYNKLLKDIEKYSQDPLYDALKKWMSEIEDSATKYNAVKEKLDSYLDYDIFSNNFADFGQTKTFEEYRKQRQQLINNVAKNDSNSVQKVTRAVDKYLKQNYKGLYGQYDEALRYVDELEKRFGTLDQKILNSILELDAAHLDVLEREDVNTWEELEKTLERVSKLNLSNVQNLVNASPEDLNQKASDKYVFFKSLEDQVKAGKNISSKQIQRFADYGASQLSQYFTMMANGQYKMTADAKQFYETIQSFELSGFYDQINTLNNKIQQLSKFDKYLQEFDNNGINTFSQEWDWLINGLSYNRFDNPMIEKAKQLSQKGFEFDGEEISENIYKINETLTQARLDYLKAVSDDNSEMMNNINDWQRKLQNTKNGTIGGLTKQDADDILDAIIEIGDKTQNWNEKVVNVKDELEQVQHRLYDAMFPPDSDINQSALAQMSKTIQQLATKSDELADGLQSNARAANQIAQAVLRFDDAIQDVVDNYDNWLLALTEGNLALGDQAIILPQLRDAYADMLDLDGSLLTNEFLLSAQNLELMKAAIDGDIEAYEKLAEAARIAAIQALKLDPSIDMTHFEQNLEYLQRRLENFSQFSTLEIGAKINDEEFLNTLSQMLNKMNVTAAQASDILRQNLGIDTQIIQVKDQAKETQEYPVTNAVLEQVDATGYVDVPMSIGNSITTRRLPLKQRVFSTKYQPDTQSITTTKQSAGFALKVTSANKSAGGNFKYTHSSRGAGSAGVARRKAAAQKAAKSTKSSEPKPDTSTKQLKDPMQDTRDIYHDINIELRDIATDLNRIQKQQEKLYGKQLIKNLTKQSEILEQQKAKLKQKNDLQRLDLRQKKEELELLGLTFDEYDNISNYLDILGNKQGEINGLIEQQNGLIQSYNTITEKEAKDALKNQIDLIEKQKQRADNEYKNLQNKIKTYDSLKNDFQSVLDQITEKTNKQIEISIKKFNMEIEIRLDLGEAEREWNKFRKQVLQSYDLLNDTNFNKISRDALEIRRNYQSYFDVQNSNSVQSLTQHIKDIRDQVQLIDETGWSPIYGDDKQQAMDDLKNYYNLQVNQLEEIQQLIHDIDQAYLDTIDDIKDNFDSQIADYQFVTDLLEHDIDLIQLLYGDKQYEAMNAYYEQLHANGVLEIDSLRKQADYWKQMWEAAEGTEDAKKYKQAWMDTVSKLRDEIGNQIQNAQNQYINAINQIFDTLDRRLTNGLGFDYVELEWELIKKNADEYLDAINSAYALQQLQNKFNKAINETKDVKAQKALTDLMNQQLESLRAKEKLTQYDVDRAEKLLQIQQARMQLEETRNAKTSLRLKRDSQGNYSYVYAANEEQVEEAEDTLARLQNQLYNFDKDAYRRNLDDVLSAYREWKNKIIEVYSDLHMNAEDRERAIAAINEYYEQYITDKVSENNVIRLNLMNSAFEAHSSLYGQDYTAFANMLDSQKQKLIGQWIPEWNSSLQMMADQFKTGFIAKCTEAFRDIEAATDDYENKVHELQSAANEDFGKLKAGIDDTANSFSALIENNDQLISRMNEQMEVIQNLKNELQQLRQKYAEIYEEAKRAMEQTHNFIRQQDIQAANAAANAPQGLPDEIKPEPVQLPSKPTSSTPVPSSNGQGGSGNSGNNWSSSGSEPLSKWPVDTPSRIIEGIAGSIWLFGSQSKSWNNQPDRENRLKEVFGDAGPKYYEKVQEMFNVGLNGRRYGYDALPAHGIDYDYYDYWTYDAWKKRKQEQKQRRTGSFDTGGYTGTWGPEGRLAMLHQKELVLNASDTKNMLDSVSIIRNVVSNLGGNISAKLRGLTGGYVKPVQPKPADELQQSVSIQASFPAVNSKREIEEAFSELVNMAAQRAMRRV